jgi:hypothetical protein
METPSPFEQAEHRLLETQEQYLHDKSSKRPSWWFRGSNEAPSSSFTGGLSVDYRDCHAPRPHKKSDADIQSAASATTMEIEFEWEHSESNSSMQEFALLQEAAAEEHKKMDMAILLDQQQNMRSSEKGGGPPPQSMFRNHSFAVGKYCFI